MIRPLVYLDERHVKGVVNKGQFPLVINPCPANGHTKRQEMKELLQELSRKIPNVREQMLQALRNDGQYHLWNRPHRES